MPLFIRKAEPVEAAPHENDDDVDGRGNRRRRSRSSGCYSRLCCCLGGWCRCASWWWVPSVILALYIAITTFTPRPVGDMRGFMSKHPPRICPKELVCAEHVVSMVLLGVSRCSAYASYPMILLMFWSKASNLMTAASRSALGIFFPFHRLHELHRSGGLFVAGATTVHSCAHLARFGYRTELRSACSTQTAITGLICLFVTPFIVFPMHLRYLRDTLSWELRKSLHCLSLVWGLCAALHAPSTHIRWVVGLSLLVYALDFLYGFLCRTYLIKDAEFKRVGDAVQLTFENPHGFQTEANAGYVLVCVPWLAKAEWHAFSLFSHPTRPHHSSICMARMGDWTAALHAVVVKPTTRPVWISGPFTTPATTVYKYDNILLAATGIGITPALACLAQSAASKARRVNLVWICRDAALLEFYLSVATFDTHGWTLIYYTGTQRKLALRSALPRTVLVFYGRPDLEVVVRELIASIELGIGLPENMIEESRLTKARSGLPGLKSSEEQEEEDSSITTQSGLEERLGEAIQGACLRASETQLFVNSVRDDDEPLDAGELETLLGQFAPDIAGDADQLLEILPSARALKVRCQAAAAKLAYDPAWLISTAAQDHYYSENKEEMDHATPTTPRDFVELSIFGNDRDSNLSRLEEGDETRASSFTDCSQQQVFSSRSKKKRKPTWSIPSGPAWLSTTTRKQPTRQTDPSQLHGPGFRTTSSTDLGCGGESTPNVPSPTIWPSKSYFANWHASTSDETPRSTIAEVRRSGADWLEPVVDNALHESAPAPNARTRTISQTTNQAFNRKPDDDTKNVFAPADSPFRLAVGGKERLETWGMLYCGGSEPVVASLTKISREVGVKLKIEMFDW